MISTKNGASVLSGYIWMSRMLNYMRRLVIFRLVLKLGMKTIKVQKHRLVCRNIGRSCDSAALNDVHAPKWYIAKLS